MSTATTPGLTESQSRQFERDGFLYPIRVLEDDETERYLSQYQQYVARNRSRLAGMKPNQTYQVLSETHFAMKWVYDIARHPRILDAVESLIGPNILAWNTNWFTKMPGDTAYVGWHQDGTYWKLTPHRVVTAWVALTPSMASNGGLQVVAGTHTQPMLPQRETYAPDNALSRGQEIAVQVREDQATCLDLQPGEMSLHHIWIVHGSKANTSTIPRIGIAIRYVSTEVKQDSPSKPLAILVRGRDDFGHFELMPPPTEDAPEEGVHHAIVQRIRASIMPPKASAPA
jgi:non-haem Fe2+, alpha-ketoglutarate-dependent halogenase